MQLSYICMECKTDWNDVVAGMVSTK